MTVGPVKYLLYALSTRIKLSLLVLCAVLPALVIILFFGLAERAHRFRMIEEDLWSVTRGVVIFQEQQIAGVRQMMTAFSRLPMIHRQESVACSNLFIQMVKENHIYAVISAVTPEGRMFASSVVPRPDLNVADQVFIQEAIRRRDLVVGQPIIGRASGQPLIPLAYPAVDTSGQLTAILVAGLKLDSFGRLTAPTLGFKNIQLSVASSRGKVIYRQPALGGLSEDGTRQVKPAIWAKMAGFNKETTFVEVGQDGVKKIFAVEGLHLAVEDPEPYFYIVAAISYDEAFQEGYRAMLQALALMGLAGLVALGLAVLLGEAVFGRRLVRLVAAARRLEKGAADASTGLPHTGDEIGQLAQAFDEMAEGLRLAEKNLLVQKLYFEQLLENLPEAVAITGPEGGVEQVNAEFGRLFGFSKEEVLGRRLYEVICPEGQEEGGKIFHNRALTGEIVRAEARRRRKDGTFLDVALVVAPRFVDGHYGGNLIIYRDISGLKKAEREKVQAALQAATVQTAGAACHELNQPLQVLLGQLEIMVQMSHYDESIRSRIKDSLKQVERLAEVTRNLQRITRYETKDYLAGLSILDIDRSSREE